MVSNLDSSILWYMGKLGFEVDNQVQEFPDYGLKIGFLRLGDFYLELVENSGSVKKQGLPLAPDAQLNGMIKLGFLVDNIDTLFNGLKQLGDVDFVTSVGTLPPSELEIPWPKRFFIVNDQDGNMLQFFSYDLSESERRGIRPWLAAVTVKDLETSKKWYMDNLGFSFHIMVGEPGNQRAILERDNFILELFEPSNVTIYDQIPEKPEYQGFRKLAFQIPELTGAYEKFPDSEVIMSQAKSDLSWATKHTIIKDIEGNWLQFLEVDDAQTK